MRATAAGVVFAMVVIFGGMLTACNLGDDESTSNNGETPECTADAECDNGVCDDDVCVQCVDDADCDHGVCAGSTCVQCVENADCEGDDVCEFNQCVSGCDNVDCGGGSCVDDGGEIYCECDEGYVLEDDTCVEEQTEACPELFCDELEIESMNGIFVSRHGDDADPGTHSRPVRTIQQGVDLAAELDDEDRDVYIGDGEFEESVVVSSGVSLYGKYHHKDSESWERDGDYETVIVGGGDDRFRPLRVENSSESLTIEHVRVETGDVEFDEEGTDGAAQPGEAVAAVMVENNSEAIAMDYLEVDAGEGVDGMVIHGNSGDMTVKNSVIVAGDGGVDYSYVDGELTEVAGTSVGIVAFGNEGEIDVVDSEIITGVGADGEDGEPGETGEDGADGEDGEFVNGGEGVTMSCAFSDDPTPSGDGGDGGTQSWQDGINGKVGETSDGMGGSGGMGEIGCQETGGSAGQDGQGPSAPGFDGEHAFPTISTPELSGVAAGTIIYRGTSGRPGLAGAPGYSGGGGGGGGALTNCGFTGGGGGGAGGTGGCGGEGGAGGEFAGGAIGVISHTSRVYLVDTAVRTEGGGRGGAGAVGGEGGSGGSGGAGATGHYVGGDGGQGSPGGQGGAGAGGEGGPSIGILHQASELEVDGVEFDLGSAGLGGTGAAHGNDGPTGIRSQIHSFD